MSRENIGETIIQEYEEYEQNSGFDMSEDRNRFWQASKIYRKLKSAFDSSALYSDASWAYRKARRMEKSYAFFNAHRAFKRKQWKTFIKNIFKWISDNFVQLLADYGESPIRVLISLTIVWLGFALAYWLSSAIVLTVSGFVTHNLLDALAFSLGTMTTIQPVGLEAQNNSLMRFLMPLETLLAIALTGLFGFVLGNRINRM